MKKADKQILSILQAFNKEDVLKAIDFYNSQLEGEDQNIIDGLEKEGWLPVKKKPDGKEFYFLNGKYWIQTEEAKLKEIEKVKKLITEQKSKIGAKKKTSSELSYITSLKCSKCGSGLYKQKVCPRCKEGKKGYTLRLICEENPDHEFLI